MPLQLFEVLSHVTQRHLANLAHHSVVQNQNILSKGLQKMSRQFDHLSQFDNFLPLVMRLLIMEALNLPILCRIRTEIDFSTPVHATNVFKMSVKPILMTIIQ